MQNTPLSAGDTIDSQCTRCRAVMNHTIVAMVGERVARVECNTCGGVHNYRAARATTKKTKSPTEKKTTARGRRKDPAAVEREEWAALRPSMQSDRARAYDMNEQYRSKDLVEHPVFGLGVVQSLPGPKKIEVLFEDGKKLLRCG